MSADDVARERATQYVQKACQWLPPMTGEQQDRLLNEIAAVVQAERARSDILLGLYKTVFDAASRYVNGHYRPREKRDVDADQLLNALDAIRALAGAGTAGDAGRDKP